MKFNKSNQQWTPEKFKKIERRVTIALALISFLTGPFVTIFALNTLFSLIVPYSISTWASALWIQILLVGRLLDNNSSKI